MDFYRKYELLDALPGEGASSFRGLETATGRGVCVHLLPGGHSPENDALLARIRALPPESLMQLIEVGEFDGALFVVTDAPPYEHFLEWIREQDRATAERQKLSRGGAWKIPVAPLEPAAVSPPPARVTGADLGEATREFESPAGHPKPAGIASPSSPAEATRQMPAASKTPSGAEATRQMPIAAMPSPAAEATRQMPAASKTPSGVEATRQMPIAATPSPAAEATRQMSATTKPAEPPDNSGEATRVFQSAAPPSSPSDPALATEAAPQMPKLEKPWLHRAWHKLAGKSEESPNQ